MTDFTPRTCMMCSVCGGTGEEYSAGLQGDGWTGHDCPVCAGCGELLHIQGKVFARAGRYKNVYRDERGRFARIPRAQCVSSL